MCMYKKKYASSLFALRDIRREPVLTFTSFLFSFSSRVSTVSVLVCVVSSATFYLLLEKPAIPIS